MGEDCSLRRVAWSTPAWPCAYAKRVPLLCEQCSSIRKTLVRVPVRLPVCQPSRSPARFSRHDPNRAHSARGGEPLVGVVEKQKMRQTNPIQTQNEPNAKSQKPHFCLANAVLGFKPKKQNAPNEAKYGSACIHSDPARLARRLLPRSSRQERGLRLDALPDAEPRTGPVTYCCRTARRRRVSCGPMSGGRSRGCISGRRCRLCPRRDW